MMSNAASSASAEEARHDRLIERHIDASWDRYPGGRADARLLDSGVPVWALIGQLEAGGDLDQVAADYSLPREAVEAALAYYRRHRALIDARILLNTA
jgi:uncharacterized protein (DUF433 family)